MTNMLLTNQTIINQYTMKLSIQLTLVLLLSLFMINVHSQEMSLTSCISFSGGVCIQCQLGTHLDSGICYSNILGCLSYINGTRCNQCAQSLFVLNGGLCSIAPGVILSQDQGLIYLYGGINSSNPAANYGQSNFMPTTIDIVKSWPTFIALNTYILNGQYSHFISKMSNPIFSVYYYIANGTYSYKLLYYGSGGGLFLCIANIPQNMSVILRSLTPISASDIIDFCADYDIYGHCLQCNNSYHLENGVCYQNMGGCVRYRQNICIQCISYYILIENRCVSDCISLADSRDALYYGTSVNTSTLQSYYGVSIVQFYSFSITQVTTTVTTTTVISGGTTTQVTNGGSSSSGGATIISTTPLNPSINGSISSNITNTDPNCANYNINGICTQCAYFYYKNIQNICQQVNPLCATYNNTNGNCQTCYPSYMLSSGQCIISKN